MDEAITGCCLRLCLNAGDPDYRSVAWLAFQECYRAYVSVWDPAFWTMTFAKIEDTLRSEKRIRSHCLYRMLSLDVPVEPGSRETFLDTLSAPNGDFTNGAAFRDFVDHLSDDPRRLARRLIDRDTLEEARSCLGWSTPRLCSAVEELRSEVMLYEAS